MKKKKMYTQVQRDEDLYKLLGLSHAETARLKLRTDLVVGIVKTIEKQNLTHAEAAIICGIGRTIITAIANGNIQKISTDRLLEVAYNLGVKMTFKIAS